MIMTSTRIIDAQGTNWVREGAGRRWVRRAITTSAVTLGAIFLSAAGIGLGKAIFTPGDVAPKTDNSVATFNDGWDTGLGDVLDIGSSPAGKAKINNCLTTSHDATAFHTCLDR